MGSLYHDYTRSNPLQLLPGPIRSPVACRVDANVDAMEHRILEVLCIVSEHNDVLRTNGGSYTCYTQQVLKDLASFSLYSTPPSNLPNQTLALKDPPKKLPTLHHLPSSG